MAIEHMARKADTADAITSTREISEAHHIPNPILAKVLQKLAGRGVIKAVHGTKGGYVLTKKPTDISVIDVIQIFDGAVAVADCFKEEKITCPQWDGCLIKTPFYELNRKIHDLLAETSIADLALTREKEHESQATQIPV
ncbi:MAG: Rrf2 family transcriptional regulator [Deltaproteobacteria bacterium]|nr:Rrf2 family transcriptional regulator [Deltaproteobacteria bacterium]